MKNKSKIFFGVFLLTFGGLILLNNLDVLEPLGITVSLIWSFIWPTLFLGLGIIFLFDKNVTPGIFFLMIGSAMLANRLLSWSFWSTFWPLILIGIGLSIILRKDEKLNINNGEKISEEDTIKDNVVFWGVEKKIVSKNFKGGEINTVFGGYQLDLREAKLSKDGAKLNINCAFGGIEVLVSDNYRVKTNGTGILGGWVPNIPSSDVDSPVLEISGVATLGGVEIKG